MDTLNRLLDTVKLLDSTNYQCKISLSPEDMNLVLKNDVLKSDNRLTFKLLDIPSGHFFRDFYK